MVGWGGLGWGGGLGWVEVEKEEEEEADGEREGPAVNRPRVGLHQPALCYKVRKVQIKNTS